MNELTGWKVGQAEEQDDGCELLHSCQIAAMKRMILAQSAIENKWKQVYTAVHLSALPVQWWLEAFNKAPVSFVIIRRTGGSYQNPEKWKALSFECVRVFFSHFSSFPDDFGRKMKDTRRWPDELL